MLESERARSQACQRYLREVVTEEELFEGRDRIAAGLEGLYVRRLQLPEARERAEALRSVVEARETVLVEMAHDGQLPHLGIVRLVLKAHAIAAAAKEGLALYLVGDHYTADMRPENLYLGLPLRGVDADQVKNPLTVPVGRKQRHIPFRELPPPTARALDELERRSEAWLVNNATHASRKTSLPALKTRLRTQMELLRESARRTRSFGDWLMRVQACWFEELLGGFSPRLAILPMSGIVEWAPEILERIAEFDARLSWIKAEVSEAQRSRGETPYSTSQEIPGSFWIYCPTCRRRSRAKWDGEVFSGFCATCREGIEARWPEEAARVMPDIVAYELALFHTGVSGWVVGSRAPYHPVIEEASRALFGREMPPKFFLTTKPRFCGLGEPAVGNPRARLFRVLLEMEPEVVRKALDGSWESDPVLRSPFL